VTPQAQRKAWFERLKQRYPASRWREETKYFY
jgi:hypothetical protein